MSGWSDIEKDNHHVGDDCQPGHDQPDGAVLGTCAPEKCPRCQHIAVTATGKVLTNAEVDKWVVEAEEGYDLTELVDHKGPVNWVRWRFKVNEEDSRPLYAPTPGPWWETGIGDGYAIVVAYLRPGQAPKAWWPDAHDVSFAEPCEEITFTDRFPEPEWWKERHGRN